MDIPGSYIREDSQLRTYMIALFQTRPGVSFLCLLLLLLLLFLVGHGLPGYPVRRGLGCVASRD